MEKFGSTVHAVPKSGHVIDTASRARQFTRFFAQRQRARLHQGQAEAEQKQSAFLTTISDGNRNPGQLLSHTEIITRLRRLNPNLVIIQSLAFPDRAGIYIRDGKSNLDDLNLQYRGLRHVAAMAWGMVPENTTGIVTKDEKGDPQGKVTAKGWRTTLCQLIQSRLITLTAAEKAFGSGGKDWHLRLH